MKGKFLALAAVGAMAFAFSSAPASADHTELNGNGLPHIPMNDSFRLNIHAFNDCPAGAFDDSNRRTIVVQAGNIGDSHPDATKLNDILLRFDSSDDRFQIVDGNACDNDEAKLILPELVATSYEVYLRLVGTPGTKINAALCGEDPGAHGTVCSLGTMKTRGHNDKYSDETKMLLSTPNDGHCGGKLRCELFADITSAWWDWIATNKAKASLVFVPCDDDFEDAGTNMVVCTGN